MALPRLALGRLFRGLFRGRRSKTVPETVPPGGTMRGGGAAPAEPKRLALERRRPEDPRKKASRPRTTTPPTDDEATVTVRRRRRSKTETFSDASSKRHTSLAAAEEGGGYSSSSSSSSLRRGENDDENGLRRLRSFRSSSIGDSSQNTQNQKVSVTDSNNNKLTITKRGAAAAAAAKIMKCEKCDGHHEAGQCPWFRKDREAHPDARPKKKKLLLGGSDDDAKAIVIARSKGRVVAQPPDGSCLFHSLSYGLRSSGAASLRREIASFIRQNPDLPISDTPLKDWIKWESLLSVSAYTAKMAHSGWGGGVELAAAAELKNVTIEVYEPSASGYKRISVFHKTNSTHTVRVLYRGGVHYDALLLK
mmetsp:Transcript_34294/g.110123  ORF Transcript_34294/g.110123 Transcript_34294/m.110123 type:complete len:364 (+) Transcript_34294:623-1714(+)